MNGGKAPACVPTWRGHIETTKDALIIFEACFTGALAHCFRRPHDRERNQLIVSGNVFVYEEATSGIKRWTDGIPWSPSRILTNFLIYRQLNNPFPPGEKKRATKRGQRPARQGDLYSTPGAKASTGDESYRFSPGSPSISGVKLEENVEKDANRGLLGSLVDSYEFKENGLLKKTMTVVINNVHHHLVSYYSLEDAKYNLETPRDDPRLKDLPLREELLNQPKFKFPNFDDAGDGTFDQMDGPQSSYAYYPGGYDPTRHLSVASQGHAPHHEPSGQVYYPGLSQYTTPMHGSTSQAGYASVPSTPSTYITMPSTPTSYHQNLHHSQHASHHHGQHPAQHQAQHIAHHHSQSQNHPSAQQITHPSHSTYTHTSQYSSPPNSSQQLAYPEQSTQQMGFPSSPPTHGLPRPPGVFEFLEGGQASFSPNSDFYSSNATSVAPVTDSTLMLPQPWHAHYVQPYTTRPDAPSYASYRAQS